MIGLNSRVDTNIFNNYLKNGGGTPIITKKNVISLKAFISILLKLFRKDFNSRIKRGGFYDENSGSNLGTYSGALKTWDLNYSTPYQFIPRSSYERDFV